MSDLPDLAQKFLDACKARGILAATAECGPVLAGRQNVRPAGARAKSVPRLRLVAQ